MDTNREPTIDPDAPVAGTSEIVIEAPPDTVWDVLTAIDDWPTWNPDVKEASLNPLPRARNSGGRRARVRSSTLQHVDRPR